MATVSHITGTRVSLRIMLDETFRKLVPAVLRPGVEATPLRELERLARLSPHLLPDLGFRIDPARGGTGLTVWRRGRYVVTVAQEAGGGVRVDVHHER